ncbi:MAG: ferritin [Candidatus Limiplasma sp.]|nr:ferritin [Candidatus Limiplasma sp.]
MFDAKVTKLLNEQINKEFYSAYLYLAFANHFTDAGLIGYANWYTVQAQEERDHAMLFIKYMQNNDLPVTLEALAKPEADMSSHLSVIKEGLAHEQFVTASINAIYEAAQGVKDFRTMQFLDWFIKEQAEEETNATEQIRKYELFGADAQGLFLLDKDLGMRTYAPPSLVL